jgi:hypothetical protein
MARQGKLDSEIAELRNKAIHRGDLPSRDDAMKVWETVHALVRLQNPLPTP